MFGFGTLITIAMAAAPILAGGNHANPRRHHKNEVANRARGDVAKRSFNNARATYFAVGLGACGIWNKPSDFIVALDTAQFGSGYPGPNCFKTITITYGGKSAQATITDECPSCDFGQLDFSQGLFEHFADTSVGVFYMSWSFNDGSSEPVHTTKPDPPKTTSKYTPPPPEKTTTKWTPPAEPSTTWTPPTTTWKPEATHTTSSKEPETTWSPPATTSTHSTTSSTSHSPTSTSTSAADSSSSAASSASASAAAPSASGVGGKTPSDDNGNLQTLNAVVLSLGGILAVGAQ